MDSKCRSRNRPFEWKARKQLRPFLSGFAVAGARLGWPGVVVGWEATVRRAVQHSGGMDNKVLGYSSE